ncbi:Uncharacterised protein [Mycobacteroides abscessus subsp. abscessus]|nr:Uncharacterised protein [Mycobacteroides abscessus subsp. abscessus]
MVTGSPSSTGVAGAVEVSPGSKQTMSLMNPSVCSAQRARTRIPVRIWSGESTSTACSSALSAPSRVISAQANGRSKGWPGSGSRTQVHVLTVPVSATSTNSVSASLVTGSYSGGGTSTRPSEPRTPTILRARRPVRNLPMVGPTDLV